MNIEEDTNYYKLEGENSFDNRIYEISYVKYTRALKHQPQDYSSHLQIARTLYRMQKYNILELKNRKLMILDPTVACDHFNRGLQLSSYHRYKEAETSYKQALVSNPNCAYVHCHLAIALMKQGKYAEASESCQKTVELEEQDDSAHNISGYLDFLQGEYNRAILSFDKAISLAPRENRAIMNKAIVFYVLENREEIVEILQKIKRKTYRKDIEENLGIYGLELERLRRQELIDGADENKDIQRKICMKGIQWMVDFLQEL